MVQLFFFFWLVNIFSILIVSHPLLSSASHILFWSHFPPLHDRFSFISFSFAFSLILFQFSCHCLLAFLNLKSLEFLFLIRLALIYLFISPSSSSFSAIFLPLSVLLFCLIFSFLLLLFLSSAFLKKIPNSNVHFIQWSFLPFPESGGPVPHTLSFPSVTAPEIEFWICRGSFIISIT